MRKKFLEELALKSSPVYKLHECIALKLSDAEDSENNEEKIKEKAAEIKEKFKRHIYFFDGGKHSFIENIIKDARNGGFILNDNTINLEVNPYAGYLYFFSHENELYIIFPEELSDIYKETIAEEDFNIINERNCEMAKYAMALLNLYGIYEIIQYVNVWNQHHKEKIDRGEAERFLNELLEFGNIYYLDDEYEGYVIYDSFMDYDEIDDMLEKTEGVNYYMPTKSVINLYREEDSIEELPEALKISELLNEYVPNDNIRADTLRFSIIMDCRRTIEKPIDIVNTLHEYDFPVENKEAMSRFEKLYRNLFQNSHIWELHGFTPLQYEQETGKKIDDFKFPKFELVAKKKKKR